MLWPGRPGGNGDGSEEFMNGLKYGEMRGPWVYSFTNRGTVADLKKGTDNIKSFFDKLFSVIGYVPGVREIAGFFGLTQLVIEVAPNNDTSFDGATYYVARMYGSGRRLKTEYELYDYKWSYLRTVTKYVDY